MPQAFMRCALCAGLLLGASTAWSQTARNSSAPPSTNVQIQFNGIISTTVMLNITGGGPTTLTGATSALSPTRAVGTIDLGTFSSLQPLTSTNSQRFRASAGIPGAIVAATVSATILYQGNATGSVTVARKVLAGALPDIPLANLRIASPELATWTAGTDGAQVPNAGAAGYDVCIAAGDATCVSDKVYAHNLAVFVPDSQPAGPFSTTVVYTATSP